MNVAESYACKYCKEKGTFQYLILARRLGKQLCFLKGQCLTLDFEFWYALDLGCNIHRQIFVNEGTVQTSLYD